MPSRPTFSTQPDEETSRLSVEVLPILDYDVPEIRSQPVALSLSACRGNPIPH